MPVDPQVRVYLDQLAAAGGLPVDQLSPQQVRAQADVASEQLGPVEPVYAIEDHLLTSPEADVPVRIYRPSAERPLGAMVYYHGGGWVAGSVATHDGYCRSLARAANVAIISVDYRLAPEHRFPAAAEDAFHAWREVVRRADALGLNPNRMAVGGDSAGGNLAAAVTLMARDRGVPLPAMQILVYPVCDHDFDTTSYLENAEGFGLTRRAMQWFWDQYVPARDDRDNPYASPLRAEDLSGLPPAVVLTAEYDPLRDEGEAYARRLQQAGVPVEFRRYDGMIHGFVRRFGQFDQSQAALKQVAGALRRS